MKRLHPADIKEDFNWDIILIGGGATGLGTALDAASRGYKTLLVEQSDFAKGTSSRSTKLVHGGVRYLAQGDIGLVKHALEERGILQKNAEHLVAKEAFLIPCYNWFSTAKYLIGLTLYDWLSGKYSFGKSKYFSKTETLQKMPGIKAKGLKGAIQYYDGKFDDARLAINIGQTAIEQGATILNYTQVTGLLKNETGEINGVTVVDVITGKKSAHHGKMVINATGIFVDEILQMSDPNAKKMVRPSQGVHIVLSKEFLNSDAALMIPKTSDGRVLFAVPWHEHLLVGTTDTPLDKHSLEPRALKQEVDFIVNTAQEYLQKKPNKSDILSVFSGLRPLAAPTKTNGNSTKEISRDHKLVVSAKGLITITGGKWTTYRRMAEETVNLAIKEAGLPFMPCKTKSLPIHGNTDIKSNDHLDAYGTDRDEILSLLSGNPELNQKLHPDFPYLEAEVVWSARNEMAETVEDILSRRLRVLFINAAAAKKMAPKVAFLLARESGEDESWEKKQVTAFNNLADGYLYQG
ncbi:glycerol-3-phosphate dehydrogenase/oxidase [Pedobacter sp. AW1-32]|uniref:glycerol-3-phosphate dehydrogenase/oxidase n=1 Tax=Pedobacter sp. AW1-32 TaxID=3383026 RepID=UPI003FF058C4